MSVLLGGVEAPLNQMLALDPATPDHLQKFQQKIVELRMTGTAQSFFILFTEDKIFIQTASLRTKDVFIAASPAVFLALALSPLERHPNLIIEGDLLLARDLQAWMSTAKIDWARLLQPIIGTTGTGFVLQQAETAHKTFTRMKQRFQENLTDYVQLFLLATSSRRLS